MYARTLLTHAFGLIAGASLASTAQLLLHAFQSTGLGSMLGGPAGDDGPRDVGEEGRHGDGGDETALWLALLDASEAAGHSCRNGTHPTSLNATVRAGDVRASISARPPADESPFVPVDFAFRAHRPSADGTPRPQTAGGDLFVLEVRCHWPAGDADVPRHVLVRSAAYARDGLDGTYVATLPLPRAASQSVRVSIRHYSACFEGLRLPDQLQGETNQHVLDFGPVPWEAAGEAAREALARSGLDDDAARRFFANGTDPRPGCPASPDGTEGVLRGAWVETVGAPPPEANMTIEGAEWTPIACSLGNARPHASFRIGDSTMPQRNVEVGIPYAPYISEDRRNKQARYMEALLEYNSTTHDDDTFLYGGGLHHLFNGHFNVPAVAAMVTQTICQAALVFSGRIYLKGPNPVQQHLFPAVDQTALNVRRINWELQTRLRRGGYALARVCGSMSPEELAGFVCLPDEEQGIMTNDEEAAAVLLQKFNYSWERDASLDQKTLAEWIRGMPAEERSRRYGSRKVGWINLEEFLLPRPEVYRENDKIHDGSDFFFGPHAKMLSVIEGIA